MLRSNFRNKILNKKQFSKLYNLQIENVSNFSLISFLSKLRIIFTKRVI